MKIYLHFNSTITTNSYDILFQHEDPINGHFKRLLCKKDTFMRLGFVHQSDITYEQGYLPILEPNQFMAMTNLSRVPKFKIIYGESAFETISYILNNEYSAPCLRLIIAQTFCNAIVQNDPFAIRCIKEHIDFHYIKESKTITTWKEYIARLALPYGKGNVHGGLFVFVWLSKILNLQILIWSPITISIVKEVCGSKEIVSTLNIIQLETNRDHVYYEPLEQIEKNRDENCSSHTTTSHKELAIDMATHNSGKFQS